LGRGLVTISLPKMRIGEVHTLLREEFPNIELSKIRYYEDKGLVRPSRSRKGYRLYSANDVDYVKRFGSHRKSSCRCASCASDSSNRVF